MSMKKGLTLQIHPKDGGPYAIEVDVKRVGCSRHATRDTGPTEEMLEDRRSQGYQAHGPAGICFRSRYLITNEDTIEVQGPQTSGEIEFVAIRHRGSLYVSVGSDHNDRSLEYLWTAMLGKVFDTAKSKQMVPAVVAQDAWLYEDVRGHWDEIVLKSFVTVSGRRVPYQELGLGAMLDLEYYVNRDPWMAEDGSILFGGSGGLVSTLPESVYQGQSAMDGVTFPPDFHFEVVDPVLGRSISHGYSVISLEESGSFSL